MTIQYKYQIIASIQTSRFGSVSETVVAGTNQLDEVPSLLFAYSGSYGKVKCRKA